MMIKCISLGDSRGENENASWLQLGRVYKVLMIDVYANGEKRFGIISQHNVGEWPILSSQPTNLFEIVSTEIPISWRVLIYQDGGMNIAPQAWQAPGFFESFYEHDPEVYSIYLRELKIIESAN